MLLLVFVGLFLLRLAERTLLSLLFHVPPLCMPTRYSVGTDLLIEILKDFAHSFQIFLTAEGLCPPDPPLQLFRITVFSYSVLW